MTRSISLNDKELKQIQEGILPDSLVKKVNTALKPRSARYGKQKGMAGQIWVADKLASLLGMEWEQSDDNSPIAVRPSGQHGCDIILRGKAYESIPFDIEVKWAESFNFNSTIEQASTNTKKDRMPLIVHKRKSFAEPVVILNWSDFEEMLDGYIDYHHP